MALLYFRTKVYFRLYKCEYSMPLIAGFMLIALVIWLAENVATFTHVWLYPSQADGRQIVGVEKWGSWLLLMIISFIMIDVLRGMFQRIDTA